MTRQRLRQWRYPLIALSLILGLLGIHHQYRITASPAAVQRVQTITISNAGFLPNKLTARKGEVISLTVINTDIRPHNLVIRDLQVSSIDLKPSQSTTLQFSVDQEGQFPFVSDTPGYPETGYQGVLIVN